jgi:peptidoglycan/LPS O-acetylase OafA/YrhL
LKLGDLSAGRDNNFNLIRMLAAYAVLISHSYALTAGSGDAEPGRGSIGLSLGAIAVHVFFLASGFLVSASLLNRRSVIEFAWARALRIVPALLVMLVLVALVLGPVYTSLPLEAYLRDGRTWEYMLRNAVPVARMAFELPGVFEGNPYKTAVNGSLWTLPYEVRMYIALALLWVAAGWAQGARAGVFVGLVVLGALLSGCHALAAHFAVTSYSEWSALGFMFFMGASFYVFRHRIKLTWLGFGAVLFCWALTIQIPTLFFPIYIATVGYALFFLAYVPGGVVRSYNRLGDISYGIYIYAFPVQQAVIASIPGASVTTVIAVSTLVTVPLAMLSWHLVEKRALNLKVGVVAFTRRILRLASPAHSLTAKPNVKGPGEPGS